MKYIGIDYGSKHIGVAASDADGLIAFPRMAIENDAHALSTVVALTKHEHAACVVVGDTRSLSGEPNPITENAEAFVKALSITLNIPVITSWEAWSSVEAARYAPRGRGHSDAAAAAIILQRYLDMHPSKSAVE